jgi:hypothetical protein
VQVKKSRRKQGYWKEGQKRIKEQRKEKRKEGIMEKKAIIRNQKTEKGGKNGGNDWKKEHK